MRGVRFLETVRYSEHRTAELTGHPESSDVRFRKLIRKSREGS